MANVRSRPLADTFLTFLWLGCTSFGGPVAHIAIFREALVTRRKWFSEADYAAMVALCQFLPGPASSQVGMAMGLTRAGVPGMLAAWVGFTLPSAILMTAFALGIGFLSGAESGWLAGLKLAVVGVVANALWGMAKSLANTIPTAAIALVGAVLAIALPGMPGQLLAIGAGAFAGTFALSPATEPVRTRAPAASPQNSAILIGTLVLLLLGLPFLGSVWPNLWTELVDSMVRAGALVFGGGHVVLPLLEAEIVRTGIVDADTFIAGYGAAQAVPGPLFTFSAFLGASASSSQPLLAAALACVAIFLPSLLLVPATLPLWTRLQNLASARAAMNGINAAVVGLLAAALWNPVITSAIVTPAGAVLALVSFAAMLVGRLPAWLVVALGALIGLVPGVGPLLQ